MHQKLMFILLVGLYFLKKKLLTHNVLVSSVEQSKSVIHTNISLFSHIGYYKLLSRFSYVLQYLQVNHSVLYSIVYTLFPPSQFFPPPNGFTYGNYKGENT